MPKADFRKPLPAALAVAAILLVGNAGGGHAGTTKLASVEPDGRLGLAYTISFWGIPFGHTDFNSKFHEETYSTNSHFETSGIVSVFW